MGVERENRHLLHSGSLKRPSKMPDMEEEALGMVAEFEADLIRARAIQRATVTPPR